MGFLELPAELRNRVYHFALIKGDIIRPQTRSHCEAEGQAMALLGVCQQIRREARQIYYMKNKFGFCCISEIQNLPPCLLAALSPKELIQIGPVLLKANLRRPNDCSACKNRVIVEIDIDKKKVTILNKAECCRPAQYFTELQQRFRQALSTLKGHHRTGEETNELAMAILRACHKRFCGSWDMTFRK